MATSPDLIIDSITAPLTVERNATLNFSYAIKNAGTASASGGIGISASIDREPFTDGPVDDTVGAVAGLSAGATKTGSSSFSTTGLSVGEHTLWVLADDFNSVDESDEANNLTAVTFTIVNTKPDFTITSVVLNESASYVIQGDDLDFEYVVKNLGGLASGTGSIFYSFDAQPNLANRIGPIRGATLEANESTLISDSISTSGLSVGTHTLWIGVDATKAKSENDETNNFMSVTFTVTAEPMPDQIIESITGPSTVVQGGDLNFSFVLKDINSENTTNSFGAILFGIDQQPTSSSYDYSVGAGTLPGGGSLTFNEVLHANLTVGQHTLWIKADGLGNVTESNKSNNLKSFTFTVTAVAQPGPDLIVDSVNAPLSVVKGSSFDFSYVVKNIGTGSTTGISQSAFVLDSLSGQPAFDATSIVDPLAVGATATVTESFFTSNLDVGQHTLYVLAEWGNTLTELDETNNWKAITFNVTAPPTAPDVTVKTLSMADSVLEQGERVNFSFTLENLGAGFANIARAAYWIDDNAPRATWAYNMPPGDGEAGPYSDNFSTNTLALSPGQHTLWVDADYFGEVAESNETNNRASITFTVTAGPRPDLVVSSITAPTTIAKGALLNFSYVIENVGTQSAGSNYATFGVDDQGYSNPVTVDPLVAGEARTLSRSIDTSTLSVGEHTLVVRADGGGGINEIYETNNVRSVTFTVTAAAPDLLVTSITAGASVLQGQAFGFSYVVKNASSGLASTSWVGIMVDQQPDASHSLAVWTISQVAAGASEALSASIDTSTLSVGQHTLWIKADYTGLVTEGDETNNATSVTFMVAAPPRPDLVVSSITAGASVMQGQAFNFSYVVENIGTLPSGGMSWAGIMLDQQPDSTHFLGYNQTNALAADGTQTLSNSIDTSKLSVGIHTLYIAADYWTNMVGESNEANNWRSITFTVTAPPPPDLDVISIAANASVVKGALFNFSYVIENIGAGLPSGQNWAGIMIDHDVDQSHYVGFNAINALAAGASQTLTNSIDTSSLAVGTHTFYVAADYWGNQVVEGDETNNVATVTFTVTQADLEVSGITAGASVMQGQAFNFSYMVENIGTATAGSNWAGVWIDQQPGSGNAAGFNLTNALAADGTQTLSNSIDTSKLSVGIHTLYIAADYWTNMVGEINETNNWRSVTFTVTAPPPADLDVTGITANASVVKGALFNFSYVIENIGAGLPSGPNWAGIMIDHDADQSHYVAFNTTGALAAGASSQPLTNSIDTSNLTLGTHTLYVAADYWGNQVPEGDETNNVAAVTFTVTQADLEVSGITAGASVMQGQAFNFSYVIENIGTATAGSNWAGIWIDQQPGSGNAAGFNLTNALAADGTQTLSNSIDTSKLSVGIHTLYIAADYWTNMVGESNEANNWRSITFTVTAPPPPDLDVTSIAANASVVKGALFNFSYVIENIGAGLPSGQNWAGIMIDHDVDQSHYVGFNSTGALAAGASQTLTNSIDTSSLAVGTHTLYVAADYWGNQVVEGNETNNGMSVTFDVTAPDLEVSSITAGASVVKGQAFNFSYVIENIGTAAAGANWAGIWIDQQPGSGNAAGFNLTNGLSVGNTQTLSNSIDTSGLSVGTHTLWIAADYWHNQVVEGNEANNWRSVTFTVTGPDLVVEEINAPASVVQGDRFDFSYVVKNAGVLSSASNWAGIMIDHDVDPTHYVAFNMANPLAAGASQTLTNSIDTSTLIAGTHTLHIAADYWANMVGEGNEANNSLTVTFTVTDPFS